VGALTQSGALQLWRPERWGETPWLAAVVTTRHGGTSEPPYDSLNLGLSTGDDASRVHENRTRLCAALGVGATPIAHLSQVHGRRIWRAGDAEARQGDGLWTDGPGVVLVIGVADCVPVFVWDVRQRRVALVHAGWRGTQAGILGAALDQFLGLGCRGADLRVALGPCIGPCCYTVSEDVAGLFPSTACVRDPRGVRLDLRVANRLQAEERGVDSRNIEADPPCTGCSPQTYFSHRMQGPRTGRMWALAWIRSD
jgi:YfiH family protein